MAVTVRSVGVSPGADVLSAVIVKPVGLEVGDLMIAHIVDRGETYTGTTPPEESWTLIRTDNYFSTVYTVSVLFWKIADADDVAAASFTFVSDGYSSRGAIIAIYGHNASSPIGDHEGQANAAAETITSDGIDPAAANSLILLFGAVADNNTQSGYAIATSNPASWAELYDYANNLYYDSAFCCGAATRPETTNTGNGTITTSASDANVGQLVAISPAAAGGWANIGKISGVTATDIAKVDGVAVADIAKINGVAV